MGKPTLNYWQTVHVAKSPTDVAPKTVAGTSTKPIQEAIDAITDASASKRYAILIHPGTYTEAVTLSDYIDLIGAGDRDEVVITQVGGTTMTDGTIDGAITCNLKNIKVTNTDSGFCLAITNAGVISCENCEFDTLTDAITMTDGGSLTLNNCHVSDGDIELSGTSACTLSLDHTEMVDGNLNAAGAVAHIISCVYCDFHGFKLDNDATGQGSLIVRNCANIGTLDDHFVTGGGYTTTIENSVINTAATKNGTVAWVIKDCYLEDIQNKDSTGSVTISGGYVKECGDSTGPIVWYEPEENEFRVITGMKIQHALNVATSVTANDTIHIGPGIFAEALAIGTVDATVPVTLQGDGRGVTIIRQTAGIPLSITDEDGVVVRDLSIEVTEAAGHQGILCHNTTGNDLTLTLYNVLIDVDAIGETTDYGVKLYRTDSGTFALKMTQCEIDVHNTHAAGAQVTYGVSLEAGDGAATKSEFKESYIKSTCDAAGTEYGVNLSAVVCELDMYNTMIIDGQVYTAGAVAHDMTFVQCDFTNQNLNSAATGATTLVMSGCSYVGTVTNAGTGAFTIRDSDVSAINGTGAGANTFYGGFLGAVTRGVGATVWWKNDSEIWVLPSTTPADPMIQSAIEAANADIIIHIAAGTFAEALLIDATDEVVTLQGAGPDKTIIRQTNETVLTIDNQDGVVVRDLKIQVTGADGDEGILADSSADSDSKTLTLYNVVIDVDATGNTIDYGIKLTRSGGTGVFGLVATQVTVDVYSTGGTATAYGISIEGGYDVGPPAIFDELRECYVSCHCATEYGINISALPARLEMYNSTIKEGQVYTAGALAHNMTFSECDFTNQNLNSAATGATTLVMSGCSYVGTVTNAGTGAFTIRDSDVSAINGTGAAANTFYGGFLGAVTRGVGATVWWKTGAQVYEVLNGMAIGDAVTAANNETPTDTKRFTVKVHEGEYNEAVTMQPFIDLVGDSGESCVIYQSGANVIAAAANSRIRNVRVELLAGSDDSAIYVNDVTGVVIEECTITVAHASGNNSGILTDGTGGAEVYRCSIEATAVEDAAIVCQGTGATELYNNDLNGGLADINLNAAVSGDLQTYNNNCRGAGFRIVAVNTYNVYAHGDVFDMVTHLLTDSVRGHMFLQNEPNIALVRQGMYISDGITLATAGSPAAANPWTVLVGAGVYAEQITMVQYVNLIGMDKDNVIIDVNGGQTGITMAEGCYVANLTLDVTADGTGNANGIQCNDKACTIEDLIITLTRTANTAYGIIESTDATAKTIIVRNVRITSTDTDTVGISVTMASKTIYVEESWIDVATAYSSAGASTLYSSHNHWDGATYAFDFSAGTLTLREDSIVGTINQVGGTMTYRDAYDIYHVFPAMYIQDSLTAGAGGEVHIHGDFTPPNPGVAGPALTVSANTLVRGSGKATIIHGGAAHANITNLVLLNGNNITLKDMKLILDAGCGTGAANVRPNVIYASTKDRLWLENLWIVGDTSVADDGSDLRQCGVMFITVTDSKVINCRSEDNRKHAIHLNDSDYNTVEGCTAEGNTEWGILLLNGSDNNTVTGNISEGNGHGGINVASSSYDDVTGNVCQGNTLHGIMLYTATHCTVAGNLCQGNSAHGINIETTSVNNMISDNLCYDNDHLDAGSYDGISVGSDCTFNNIVGNQCCENHRNGIRVEGAQNSVEANYSYKNDREGIYMTAAECKISGNYVCDNSLDTAGTYVGISLAAGAHRCQVNNNYCLDIDGSHQSDGIHLADGATYVQIVGNYCYNAKSGASSGDGIKLTANNDYCQLKSNYCYLNDGYGIEIGSGTSNTVENNKLVGNVAGQISDGGTDTALPYVFVPVPNPNTNIGTHPAERLTDGVDITSRFNLYVPSEFQELVRAQLMIVAGGGGDLRRSVATHWGKVCSLEHYNADTGAIAAGVVAVLADDMTCLDIAAALTGLAAQDLVGVEFTREGSAGTDTVAADCYLLGLRLQYV